MKKYISTAAVMLMYAAPALAGYGTGNLPSTNVNSVGSVLGLMCQVAGWAFAFLIVLTVIFILLAAFNYLTAGGDPEKVKTASNQLIYAAVAVAVALIAKGFPLVIGSFLNADLSSQGC